MIGGCWVTWQARVHPRADGSDIQAHLWQSVWLLQRHRDIAAAHHRYEPSTSTVTFTIRVRYGLTDDVVLTLGYGALADATQQAGFKLPGRRRTLSALHGWLQFERWPNSMTWARR
jgi:hypothetical protein